MTARRAAIFGGDDLRAAAEVLGLEASEGLRPDLVLVDLRDASARVAAARIGPDVPRVAIAGDAERELAVALGCDASAIASSAEPAALGPLVAAALPRAPRPATRVVVVTSIRGGVGRTLLVANLARRLAARLPVIALDATGTGALGWWLSCAARPWTELEGLADELSAEHLAVAASEAAGVRVLGGAPVAPSRAIAESSVRAAASSGCLTLVDAPALADERARALSARADRLLLVSYDDAFSIAALDGVELPEAAWLIASQSRAARVGEREAFRALPRDEGAVADALARRRAVGGALGRAYDELAEVLALDAS